MGDPGPNLKAGPPKPSRQRGRCSFVEENLWSQSLRCSAKNCAFTRRKLCGCVKRSVPLHLCLSVSPPLCVSVSPSLCLSPSLYLSLSCSWRQVALLRSSLADAPLDGRTGPPQPCPGLCKSAACGLQGTVPGWTPKETDCDVQQHRSGALRTHTAGAPELGRAAVNTR